MTTAYEAARGLQRDETQRKRTGLYNQTTEHRHLNSEKGDEYEIILELAVMLHETPPP